ncbi:MAG: hypothetical protein ABWZ98_09480, partial [Nakamurella sp.]
MSDWERERQARDEARRREVLALPTAAFARHTTLEPLHETDQLVTASIGPDGDIYALWSSPGDADQLAARAVQPSWAARQLTRTAK